VFKQKLLTILGALIASMMTASVTPAIAILGGTSAAGNPIVVGLLSSQNAIKSNCTGGLVAPRVVMTAAHCLTLPIDRLWIAEPGSDLRDTSTKRIQAERYFIPITFSAVGPIFQNDFAIVVLKSSFPNTQTLEIASAIEVKTWMSEEKSVTHIGYGCFNLVEAPPCGATSPTPIELVTQLSDVIPPQFVSISAVPFSMTKISVEKTICGGDSGSPLITEIGGRSVYIGAQSSSNGAGCTKTCYIVCRATQGLPSANVDLVDTALKYASTSLPTPTPTPTPEQSLATSKKTTITCIKGKLTKKVTAVKPKCPVGYKKK
jgi:secreted trypsin-like serine protease